MITLSPAAVRAGVAVFRRLGGRRDDPAVTLAGAPRGARVRCAVGDVAAEYADPAGRGAGELTVRLSALAAAAAGGGLTLRPAGEGKVEVLTGGVVRAVVDRVPRPVPTLPAAAGPPVDSPGLLPALVEAVGVA